MPTFTKEVAMSGDSRYSITFTVTEVLPSDYIQTNKSNVNYTLTATKSSGSGYWDYSEENPVVVSINGSTVVNTNISYDFRNSTPKTITLASGTVTGIAHNSDGTKTIAVSGSFTDNGNYLGSATASGNLTLTTIPRQTTITSFTVSKRNETSLTFNWATADTVDYVWYSTNNGSSWTGYDVTDGTSGSFNVTGLSPSTTYKCKLRVRRKDSQLTTDSNTVSQTTNSYPVFTTQPTYNARTETTLDVNYKPNMTVALAQYRIKTSSGSYGNWVNIDNNNIISGSATSTAGCTFRIISLTANTNYVVQVRLKSTLTEHYTNSNEVSTNMYTYAYPYCTEAPNFTIGEDVTIKLYNPLNRSVQIRMWSYKSQTFVSDLITTSGTNYKGFSNVASRLYASIPNDTTSQYNIDVHYGSNKAIKNGGYYTINYETAIPTFNNFSYSTNLSELTGNNGTIVNGETSTTFTISTANKAISNYGASITKYRVECGTQQQEIAYSSTEEVSYTMLNCNNQVIKMIAVDSRGLETSVSKTVTNFVNYSKPSFRDITTNRNDGVETTTKLNFRVNYWDGNFGSLSNTITSVQYRSKLTTASSYGSYTTIPVSSLTLSNGIARLEDYLIHANGSSGGFEVGKSYNVEVKVVDGNGSTTLETITTISNITDGNVAFSTYQDSNGKYHVGINGMPDLNKTATVYGNTRVDGVIVGNVSNGVAYNIDGRYTGVISNPHWLYIGELIFDGQGQQAIIDAYTGDGQNGGANQNTHYKVILKQGWSGETSPIGITANCLQNAKKEYRFIISHTSKRSCKLYCYLPFSYNDLNLVFSGTYNNFVPHYEILNTQPTFDKEATYYYPNNVYSTEEMAIGTWIDGKPLYRRVLKFTPNVASSATTGSFDINIAHVDQVFIKDTTKIADTSSSGYVYTFPYITSSVSIGGYINVQSSKMVFNIRKTNNVGFYAIRLVLEYTKTTD